MQLFVITLLAIIGASSAQYILQHAASAPVAYVQQVQPQAIQQIPQVPAHRAVVYNAQQEAQLPPELLNPFYKNPRIVDALAKESWFTSKEMPVIDREAEKIPRSQILKIFKNAGFIRRR